MTTLNNLGYLKTGEAIKIFYADDDADDRFLFDTALQQAEIPYTLSTFENGQQLENGLTNQSYDCDLIFLDLNMPQKSGIETLSDLQNEIKNKQLKVVIFTTSADDKVVQKTHDLNAVLFVQKPNDFTKLVNTLETILARRDNFELPVDYKDFKFQPNNYA